LKQFSKFAGTATIVTLALAGAALAQQTQNRTYREGNSWAQVVSGSVAAAKNLRIKTEFGNVHVRGGSASGIQYVFRNLSNTSSEERARRQFEAYKVNSYVRGDTAYIVAETEGAASHNRCSGEFTVDVPRDMASVRIETEGGSVVASNIAGRLDAETGGGSIQVDEVGGPVNAQTGGDYIDIGSVGGDVNIETGGGKITIRDVKGKISAQTGGGNIVILSGQQGAILEAGGGNIQVKQILGRLKVSTGGGNIDLGDIGGPVEMETGGGSIRLASAKGLVRAETGAGRIELNGVPAAYAETGAGGIVAKFIAGGERADSVLETSVGDITVYLAPDLNMSVRASIEMANGHRISSDFPDIRVTSEGDWPGARTASAEGRLNGGGPLLKLRTTSGDIRILRASR
jgi:DUF4097 and DUF4098 domain-containing protein YvlB